MVGSRELVTGGSRGTGGRTRALLLAGLVPFIAATVLVGYGNYIKPPAVAAAEAKAEAALNEPAAATLITADTPRVRAIAAMLPAAPAGVGRPITDRAAWRKLAQTGTYRNVVPEAEQIVARGIPDQPDDLYLEFSRTGNRSSWEKVAFQRRRDLAVLVPAECIEDRGRFVPRIRETIDALCAERTWVWAAHDRESVNFEGKAVDIDLGAAELGWQIATARWLLADRLPAETSAKVVENVRRRIAEPFLAAVTGRAKAIGWMTRPNNWNAVCHAGVVGAALATVDDRETRAVFIASSEGNVDHFLRGFGSDGYCGEGLGYWNYGFGHYVLLAETVRQATDGAVDFMSKPGVNVVARFGTRIQIIAGVAPAFADCNIAASPAPQIMRYVNARFGLGLGGYDGPEAHSERVYLYEDALHAFLDITVLPKPDGIAAGVSTDSPLRTWFGDAGVLVARPGPGSGCRMGVALKGGHNAETHNHNDLGSFVVVVDDRAVLLDPGRENYTARTFGRRRYEGKLINSFGHPVPVVAGKLQRQGKDARARILKTEFTDSKDVLVMDLTSAYAVPELTRLERTFVYDRSAAGSLRISDRVEFSSPQSFGTALITTGELRDRDGNKFIVRDRERDVFVEVDCAGGDAAVTIDTEVIREDAPVTPTRISINVNEKVTAATVSLMISAKSPLSGFTAPKAGERWAAGSTHWITWEDTFPAAGDRRPQFSTDHGATWRDISADETARAAAAVRWTVPEIATGPCMLRLVAGASASDAVMVDVIPSQQASYEWTNITPNAPFAPRDGAGALTYDGRMWLIGGWHPKSGAGPPPFPRTCTNEVWSSVDGKDWLLRKPNTFLDNTFDARHDWEGRHTAGYVIHRNKMWIVGGDPIQGHYQSDVWNSEDGVIWTHVNAAKTVPWGPRVLHHTVAFDDWIWVIGGQTLPPYVPGEETFYRDVWRSRDGVDWERVTPREPFWPQRGMIGGSAVFRGRIWILGGGTYDTPQQPSRKFFNDVWSSPDGVAWHRHVEHAPWPARQYHDVAVFDDRLWVLEGFDGRNRNDVWYSSDGSNWYELPNTPWKPRHAASVFVHDPALWVAAGNNLESDVWKLRRKR